MTSPGAKHTAKVLEPELCFPIHLTVDPLNSLTPDAVIILWDIGADRLPVAPTTDSLIVIVLKSVVVGTAGMQQDLEYIYIYTHMYTLVKLCQTRSGRTSSS